MALMNCPECRRQISDKAGFCPGCGYPIASATIGSSPPPDQALSQGTTPQSVEARPAPSAEPIVPLPARPPATESTDPESLRELLLRDLASVSLRKRYLAARTPALKQRDREDRTAKQGFFSCVIEAAYTAAAFPFVMLFIFALWVAIGFVRNANNPNLPGPYEFGRLFGHGLFIACASALFLGPIAFVYGWITFARKQNRCEELGPLPDDAPVNSAQARKRFLEGG
jgi:hypothetical protein